MTGRHALPVDDEYQWHNVGFVPALSWRIHTLDDQGKVGTLPLPGWLVQEEVAYHPRGFVHSADLQSPRPVRRVVAASHVYGELIDVYESVESFWRVDPPGAPDPTVEEIEKELTRRRNVDAALGRSRAGAMGES